MFCLCLKHCDIIDNLHTGPPVFLINKDGTPKPQKNKKYTLNKNSLVHLTALFWEIPIT